jgi:hypothetical protein
MAVQKLSLRLGGLGEPANGVLVGDLMPAGYEILFGDGVLVGDAAPISEGEPISELPPLRLHDAAGLATWRGKPIYNQQQVIGQLDSGTMQPVANGSIGRGRDR